VALDAFGDSAPPLVFVATGTGFADALAGSVAAGVLGVPLLLTEPGSLPERTRDALAALGPDDIAVLGGEKAVTPPVEAALEEYAPVQRRAGANRYETAAAISAAYFPDELGIAYLATGENFPDALAAAPVAAREGAPLLLVRPSCAPQAVNDEASRLRAGRRVVLGGAGVVSDSAAYTSVCPR